MTSFFDELIAIFHTVQITNMYTHMKAHFVLHLVMYIVHLPIVYGTD